jgi:ankyrin repeat protein
MLACLVGRESMAQKLLEHGADINACNTRGENAIFIACYNGHVHVAR